MALRWRSACAVLLMTVLVAGCGWHFRGTLSGDLGVDSAAVSGAVNDPFMVQALKETVSQIGVQVVEPAAADMTIELGKTAVARRVLTTDAEGNISEIALSYVVPFSAIRASGEKILDGQRVRARRDFTYDDTSVLQKSGEEEILLREMRGDAARDIVRRLQIALTRPSG